MLVYIDGDGADDPAQIVRGMRCTTDAPLRDTETSIAARAQVGAAVVEMEAAALYAFAQAQGRPVLCLAHVTNRLTCVKGDFEKGAHNGAADLLATVRVVVEALRPTVGARYAAAERQAAPQQPPPLHPAQQRAVIVEDGRVGDDGRSEGKAAHAGSSASMRGPPATMAHRVCGMASDRITCTTRKPTITDMPAKWIS